MVDVEFGEGEVGLSDFLWGVVEGREGEMGGEEEGVLTMLRSISGRIGRSTQ